LGFTSIAAPGGFTHTVIFDPTKRCTTATATDNVGNTSEFSLGYLIPTAADVSIGGRVKTPNGRGIGRVTMMLTDQNGAVRITATNHFGYYKFNNVAV
jgi:hypothetical protein